MTLINAGGALATLVDLMVLPGAIMSAIGGYMWYKGQRNGEENRSRIGRMLLMFGIILLVIVIILSGFLRNLPKG